MSFKPAAIPKFNNGSSFFVLPLRKLKLYYDPHRMDSQGMRYFAFESFREFIQKHSIKLAQTLSTVEVVIEARGNRFPHLEAEYSILPI